MVRQKGPMMRAYARSRQFVTVELWTMDLKGVPPLQRVACQTLRLLLAVAFEFRGRLLDARTTSLVYTTLLSLVPFLAVMFSVLKAFGAHHLIEPLLNHVLEPLGTKGAEVTGLIIGFVDNLKVGVLGAVGVAGLFYTTFSLIEKIEHALNSIWRVRRGRPLARKFTDYLSVVLVGPVLMFTAFGLLASVRSHALVERVMEILPFGILFVWIAKLAPFLLLCTVLTFIYKFVPYTEVAVKSALTGGVAASLLWGLAGDAFAAFVVASGKYSAIYSSFAVLVLFLLWLYTSWMIILVGAQVSFFVQHPAAYQTRLPWQPDTPALRERLILELLSILGRRHLRGEGPIPLAELSNQLQLPPAIVEDRVSDLIDQGFLARVAEPEGIALVKPPDMIPLHEILDLVQKGPTLVGTPTLKSVARIEDILRLRDTAVVESLNGMTLRSLILVQEKAPTAPCAVEQAR